MSMDDMPERIKRHIIEETASERKNQINFFGVTELLGCPKKTFYRRIYGEEVTLQQSWWFYRGNILDEAWTTLFPRNQVRVTYRVHDYPVVISGRFDFQDEDGAIADLKTTSDLYYVKKDGSKQEHREQLMFYCWCEATRKGRLYYVSFQDAIKFDFEFSEEEMKENLEFLECRAVELWKCLKKHTESGEIETPEVDEKYDEDYWECRYCGFKERCYNGEKEKVEDE